MQDPVSKNANMRQAMKDLTLISLCQKGDKPCFTLEIHACNSYWEKFTRLYYREDRYTILDKIRSSRETLRQILEEMETKGEKDKDLYSVILNTCESSLDGLENLIKTYSNFEGFTREQQAMKKMIEQYKIPNVGC